MALFLVTPKNKKKFLGELHAALDVLRAEIDEIYRGFATACFHRLVMETPQWSGNAASNWNASVGGPDFSTITTLKEAAAPDRSARGSMRYRATGRWETPHGPAGAKGDGRAVMMAMRRAKGTLLGVTRSSHVHFCNAAESLDNKAYIQYLEENPEGFLRPVNQPGHMVERVAYSAESFGKLTEDKELALRIIGKSGAGKNLSNGGFGL